MAPDLEDSSHDPLPSRRRWTRCILPGVLMRRRSHRLAPMRCVKTFPGCNRSSLKGWKTHSTILCHFPFSSSFASSHALISTREGTGARFSDTPPYLLSLLLLYSHGITHADRRSLWDVLSYLLGLELISSFLPAPPHHLEGLRVRPTALLCGASFTYMGFRSQFSDPLSCV